MSVVVLVRAWPALPATVTSGTPAAIRMVMLVCLSECTVLWGSPAASHTLCTHVYTVYEYEFVSKMHSLCFIYFAIDFFEKMSIL